MHSGDRTDGALRLCQGRLRIKRSSSSCLESKHLELGSSQMVELKEVCP